MGGKLSCSKELTKTRRSHLPLDDEFGERFQPLGGCPERTQSGQRGIQLLAGFGLAGFQTEQAWIGVFSLALIFVRCFAHLLGRGGDVENVIDDLKREPQMPAEIGDILRNHAKEKLLRGEVVASMTVRLVRGLEIARIAKTAGFDSLYVDMEHSSFSLETTGQICMAALAAGVTPLVRVPGVAEVSRVLDGGALGVIAPHIRSAAQAQEYVTAAKFPPLGERSAAGPLPHLHYRSFPAAEADAALNAATLLIVQFESDEALAKADDPSSRSAWRSMTSVA